MNRPTRNTPRRIVLGTLALASAAACAREPVELPPADAALLAANRGSRRFVHAPDGSRVAYLTRSEVLGGAHGPGLGRDFRIVVANADGSEAREVGAGVSAEWDVSDPSWSPSGEHLAWCFVEYSAAEVTLYPEKHILAVAEATGAASEVLYDSWTRALCSAPAWSADGERLAVVCDDEDAWVLMVLASSGALVWESRFPGRCGQSPSCAWLDGDEALLVQHQGRLVQVPLDGGATREVATLTREGNPGLTRLPGMQLSSDRRFVALSVHTGAFIVEIATGETRRPFGTAPDMDLADVVWAPDDTTLLGIREVRLVSERGSPAGSEWIPVFASLHTRAPRALGAAWRTPNDRDEPYARQESLHPDVLQALSSWRR